MALESVVLLLLKDPTADAEIFIPCLWYEATGTYCPGCGITRALHALIHGHVLAALDFNAVGLAVILTSAGLLFRSVWIALRHNQWQPPVLPKRTALWLALLGIGWAVLRNLPWDPFTALAP